MNWDTVADAGINLVAVVFLAKTLAFTALSGVLLGYPTHTQVGIELRRMYVATACTSLTLTILFVALAVDVSRVGLGGWLWIEAPLILFPSLVAYFGYRVLRAETEAPCD